MKVAEIKTISFELEEEDLNTIADTIRILNDILSFMEQYECDDLNGKIYSGDITLSATEIDLISTELAWLTDMKEMV